MDDLTAAETISRRFDQRHHRLTINDPKDELILSRLSGSRYDKIDVMRQDFEDGEGKFQTPTQWINWAIDNNFSINWLKHAIDMSFLLDIKKRIDSSDALKKRYYEQDSHFKTTIDDELPYRNAQGEEIPDPFTDSAEIVALRNRHPDRTWGSHNTRLLTHLSSAATKFWHLYDPADPSTAPTNKQVETWLIEQKVPRRTAEVMATILRADGLPTGRRS